VYGVYVICLRLCGHMCEAFVMICVGLLCHRSRAFASNMQASCATCVGMCGHVCGALVSYAYVSVVTCARELCHKRTSLKSYVRLLCRMSRARVIRRLLKIMGLFCKRAL